MKRRITPTIALIVLSLSILAAQGIPSAPKNLRIVTGSTKPSAPPPECVVGAPSGKPAHAYFDALVRRAEHVCNWSLRNQAQLDSLTNDGESNGFRYIYPSDSYPDAQDAAKFFKAHDDGVSSILGGQQVRVPVRLDTGSMLITWDWFWGREFRHNRVPEFDNYKMFQLKMDGHGWWTLLAGFKWAVGSEEVGKAWDSVRAGSLAEGMVFREPWTPTNTDVDQRNGSGKQFPLYHSRWTRYWVEIKFRRPASDFTEWDARIGVKLGPNSGDEEGKWHMVSLWIADEGRNPTRQLFRVPMNWSGAKGWAPRVSEFRFEMDTSSKYPNQTGPLTGYARNVVLLKDYPLNGANPESDTFMFQRPVR